MQTFIKRPQRVLTAVANRQLREKRAGPAGVVSGGNFEKLARNIAYKNAVLNVNSNPNLQMQSERNRPFSSGPKLDSTFEMGTLDRALSNALISPTKTNVDLRPSLTADRKERLKTATVRSNGKLG